MATCHPRFCHLPRAILACYPMISTTAPALVPAAVAAVGGTQAAPQRRVKNSEILAPPKWLEGRLSNRRNSSSHGIISSISRYSSWIYYVPSQSKTVVLQEEVVGSACRLSNSAEFNILNRDSQRKCQFCASSMPSRSGAKAASFQLQRTFCASQARESESMSSPQELPVSGSNEFRKGGRYCVFLTGHASPYTEDLYGGYGKLMETLLGDPEETWDIYAVIDGQFPTEEELEKYDGFVITGSPSSAHGSEDWIARLCDLLQSLHSKKQRTLGVCFGHQVLSRALGGETGKADIGWEIGLREVEGTPALGTKFYAQGLPSKFKILEVHQDQVKALPPGATLLASSGRTGIEIFGVDDHVLGIQGHPEFFEDVLKEILDRREALGYFSEEVAKHARETLKAGEADREVLIQLCKTFLKGRKEG